MTVTLTAEQCTGAICSHCKEYHDNLLKCGRCKRAWYCSKDHQKEDYAKHKAVCRAVAPLVDALIETANDVQPPPSSYAEMQRVVASATLYAQRHGPQGALGHCIFACLSSTVFCRVCFKLREQLPPGQRLVCCPTCLWGWCCQEHWQQFEPQHQPFCAEYATMRRLGMLSRQLAVAAMSAGNQFPYPMGKVSAAQQAEVMEGWSAYRRLRVPVLRDNDHWLCMTDHMAVPLTAVWATLQLYTQPQLADMQEFNLHLVGAASFEFERVTTNTATEEVMHLLSAVKALRVVLVGPDWKTICPGPTCSTFEKDVCPVCERSGATRGLSIYRGTYEDFAKSTYWTTPTLAMACNSGVGCEEEESWARAVKVLLDQDIPSCFTSMNASEQQLDGDALKSLGAHILHTGRNPWSSLVPLRDFDAGADDFYYTNGWVTLLKGREGG